MFASSINRRSISQSKEHLTTSERTKQRARQFTATHFFKRCQRYTERGNSQIIATGVESCEELWKLWRISDRQGERQLFGEL